MKTKRLTGVSIKRDDIKIGDNLLITFPNNRRYLVLVTDKTKKYFAGAELPIVGYYRKTFKLKKIERVGTPLNKKLTKEIENDIFRLDKKYNDNKNF